MHTKKRGKKLTIAAAVCLAAAGVFFLRPSELEDKMPNKLSPAQTTKKDMLPKPASPATTKKISMTESFLTEDPLVERIKKEFPYESLNCKPNEEAHEWHKQFSTKELYELLCAVGFLDRVAVWPLERVVIDLSKCQTELRNELQNVSKNGDFKSLISIINYLDSLHIDWLEGENSINDLLLVHTFSDKYVASTPAPGKKPDPQCLIRLAHALKLKDDALEALADSIVSDPFNSEKVIADLPETTQTALLWDCIGLLFDFDEDLDVDVIDSFFSSLSVAHKEQFLSMLEDATGRYLWHYPELNKMIDISHRTINPELRETIQNLIPQLEKEAAENAAWEASEANEL